MSTLTHLQTSLFLEKDDEFTNPMFNLQRHVCPNLHKNTCTSRGNVCLNKPYVQLSDTCLLQPTFKHCYLSRKPMSLQTLCSMFRDMSALTYTKICVFLEKTADFTNPMFNYPIHVCSNPSSNIAISRESR